MPYLTKTTKANVSSTSVYSASKYSKSVLKQVLEQFLKFHSFEDKISTKGSDSVISSIRSEMSNDHTSHFTMIEPRKTAEEAKLMALQAKERAKRKIVLTEKALAISNKQLAISLDEKVDLSEI